MATDSPPMTLALFGGEGLRPESGPLWQTLLGRIPEAERHVLVLQAIGGRHPIGTLERRARLIAESLEQLGLTVEVLSLRETPPAIDVILPAPILYLAGDPSGLSERLSGSSLWSSIRSGAHRPRLATVSGGAAASLGDYAFAPVKPYPAVLESLEYEMLPGLGLLPGFILLPYYVWLPEEVIGQIMKVAPPEATLVGIDDQAALIATEGAWHVGGLGGVTILRRGSPPQFIDAGAAIPHTVLSPHRVG